jgi:prevent-host-death family protein
MNVTLRESKAKLSELVERASHGEEIVITVRGQPKVKLAPVDAITEYNDFAAWSQTLREQAAKYTAKVSNSSAEIVERLREERM